MEARCPFCGASYRRRGPWGGVALATVLATAAVLAGVLVLLIDFGDRLDRELTDQVDTVERSFDRDVRRLEDRLEQELDERLGGGAGTVPPG